MRGCGEQSADRSIQAPVATLDITGLTHTWDMLGIGFQIKERTQDHADGSVDRDRFYANGLT
jgi:hypothetical protein